MERGSEGAEEWRRERVREGERMRSRKNKKNIQEFDAERKRE